MILYVVDGDCSGVISIDQILHEFNFNHVGYFISDTDFEVKMINVGA